MSKYSGFHCPVCGSVFTDQDDIVVCPDCGTPHHRECWAKLGHCAYQDRHRENLEWHEDQLIQPGTAQQVACPACGTRNRPDAAACVHCGAPLGQPQGQAPGQVPAQDPGQDQDQEAQRPRYAAGPQINRNRKSAGSRTVPPPFPPNSQVVGPEDEIGGIKSKDWASFVRRSVPYYLMRFFQMELGGSKIAVSLSAFVFGAYYFFYRKMYRLALIFCGADLLLTVPSLVLFWYDTGSVLTANIDPQIWITLGTICAYLDWGVRLAAGLFAVYFYKKHAARVIQQVCAATPEGPERSLRLSAVGGVNLPASIAAALVMTALLCALMFAFAGPKLMEVLQLYAAQMYAL